MVILTCCNHNFAVKVQNGKIKARTHSGIYCTVIFEAENTNSLLRQGGLQLLVSLVIIWDSRWALVVQEVVGFERSSNRVELDRCLAEVETVG